MAATTGEARDILDANLYMTLATADAAGQPWATPVYYAAVGYREFVWVSDPWARHSRNLAARPEAGIVVFDSTVPISSGRAVYMAAAVDRPAGDGLARCVDAFSRSAQARGGRPWGVDDLVAPARHRLYRATASAHWVLDEHDHRIAVTL